MNNSQKALLGLVRFALQGGEMPSMDGVDFKELYIEARKHYLIGFLYRVCYEIGMPDELQRFVEKAYFGSYAQQIEQEQAGREVFSALGKENIPFMPMKGYVVRQLYPDPTLRLSCDIDFFYDETRKTDLKAIMASLGFVLVEEHSYHDVYVRGNVTLEPHHCLSEQSNLEKEYYRNVWSRLKTEDGIEYAFTPEDYYIYLFLHMKKHLESSGTVGVRTVADIHLYNMAHPDLDQDYLREEYRRFHMEQLVGAIETLSRIWFGEEPTNPDMDLLGEFVFEGNAWSSEKNRNLLLATKGKRGGKFSLLVRRVFPPFAFMKKHWPVLDKHPILLPFCWVHRWFRILFSPRIKRVGHCFQEVKAVNKEEVDKMYRIRSIVGVGETGGKDEK